MRGRVLPGGMGCYSRAGGRGGCDLALRGVFVVGQADICQLGMDQRKVNVLAREYAGKTGRKKPVILSHPMLAGLLEGQEKMSKSVAGSAIFMEDSPVRQLVCLVCGHRVGFGLPTTAPVVTLRVVPNAMCRKRSRRRSTRRSALLPRSRAISPETRCCLGCATSCSPNSTSLWCCATRNTAATSTGHHAVVAARLGTAH